MSNRRRNSRYAVIAHEIRMRGLYGWLAEKLAGWLAGWWLAGWLAGWLAAGWLAGWLALPPTTAQGPAQPPRPFISRLTINQATNDINQLIDATH